jgi:ureidoglycolate hydrolase
MQAKKCIENITPELFSKYGDVIALKPTSIDGWEIVVKVSDKGWRIAVLEFSRKSTGVLEKHPDSRESFEPMKGIAFLLVALDSEPENFEVFLLDKPVCLYAGIWHQVISLSEVAIVKITENLDVSCEYHNLENEYQGFVSTIN